MRIAAKIILYDPDKKILEKNTTSSAVSMRVSERSRIVLLSAQGLDNKVIAQQLNIPPNEVGKWRNRYAEGGIKSVSNERPRGANHGGKDTSKQARLRQMIIEKTTRENPTMQRIGPHGHWLKHSIRHTVLLIVFGRRWA